MKELVLVLYANLDDVICCILAWFLIDGNAHRDRNFTKRNHQLIFITYQYCKSEVSYMLKTHWF
jgi:hypothetical protein